MSNFLDNIVFKILHKLEDILVALSLSIIICLTIVNVVMRYILKTGLFWSDEFIGFNLLFIGILGSAIGVRDKSHTRLDSLVSKLPPKTQTIVYLFVHAVIIFLLYFFIKSGIKFAGTVGTQKSAIMKLPMKIFYVMIPAGFTLCLFEEILSLIKDIVNHECRFKTIEEQYLEESMEDSIT